MDLTALRWYRMGTPGDVFEMDDTLWDVYGSILPVCSAHEEGEEGDPKFPGDPVPDDTGALYWYICEDGSAFYVPGAVQAAGSSMKIWRRYRSGMPGPMWTATAA